MSSIKEMSDGDYLRYLKRCLEERVSVENEKRTLENRLKREKIDSVFKKAAGLFSFPFKREAFESLFEVIFTLVCTILFSGVAMPVFIAVVFCAVVDLLYTVLFGVFYPFAVLYFTLFKGARIKSFEKKLKNAEYKLKMCMDETVLKQKLEIYEKKCAAPKSASGYLGGVRTSGVESTEWYKKKSDEYYRMYMGFPPKEDKGLSDLATDTALDIDVGDY